MWQTAPSLLPAVSSECRVKDWSFNFLHESKCTKWKGSTGGKCVICVCVCPHCMWACAVHELVWRRWGLLVAHRVHVSWPLDLFWALTLHDDILMPLTKYSPLHRVGVGLVRYRHRSQEGWYGDAVSESVIVQFTSCSSGHWRTREKEEI